MERDEALRRELPVAWAPVPETLLRSLLSGVGQAAKEDTGEGPPPALGVFSSLIAEVLHLRWQVGDLQEANTLLTARARSAEAAAETATRGLAGAMAALRRPKVGLAVIVRRPDGRILMLRRKGAHGAGTWSVPGGHMEAGETPLRGCLRELDEETGIQPICIVMLPHYTVVDFGGTAGAYVTLYALADVPVDAVAVNREPEKCEGWWWVGRDEVQTPLFEPLAQALKLFDPWALP